MKGRGNKGFLPLKGEGKERGARVEEERRERKGPWAGGCCSKVLGVDAHEERCTVCNVTVMITTNKFIGRK